MTLVEENKRLKDLLEAALSGDSEIWKSEARALLNPPKVEHRNFGKKWEGEMCICRHTINVHAAGGGMCFGANCDCMSFTLDKSMSQ